MLLCLVPFLPCFPSVVQAQVVFTEDFEEDSLSQMARRWNDVVNLQGMSFSSDVPPGSRGRKSLIMTSLIGQNTGGHLYKRLVQTGGYDSLFARFYVKFAPSCHPVHHFVWLGGHNPPTNWPWPRAGIRPWGDERFSTGIEPMGARWEWDFYTYWMHMRGNPGDTFFWGNDFNPSPPAPVVKNQWVCVELMVKLNAPLSAYNGEQAFWINGQKKHHLGLGFPRGYWVWDSFHPNPDSAPFEGFQWRIADSLKANYFWLEFYMTQGPQGQRDTVFFDDVVVSTRYIGPLGVEGQAVPSPISRSPFSVRPNPFTSFGSVPGHPSERFALYDIYGRKVGVYKGDRIGADLSAGVYFLSKIPLAGKSEGKDTKPLRIVKLK